MSSPTPGPWEYEWWDQGERYALYGHSDDPHRAVRVGDVLHEADARHIARACNALPDLLAAAEAALDYPQEGACQVCTHTWADGEPFHADDCILRAAVAAAKGEG